MSTRLISTPAMKLNSTKNQNSLRRARPLNTTYFFNTSRYQFILSPKVRYPCCYFLPVQCNGISRLRPVPHLMHSGAMVKHWAHKLNAHSAQTFTHHLIRIPGELGRFQQSL